MDKNSSDIREICQQIADVYKNKMVEAGYDQNGELYNFTWNTEFNGNMFQLYFTLTDYWQYAEEGRGPGKFPPPNAILKWIQFKKLIPRTSGKLISTNQLVYLISRKIAQKGTQGKHLLQQTIDETYDTLVDQLVDAVTKQLEKELEQEYENTFK